MKKRCILFVAALVLTLNVSTGCQKTEQDESTQRLPETVTETVGDPAPAPDVESAVPTPELPAETDRKDSGKKPEKYILGVTVDGEDF